MPHHHLGIFVHDIAVCSKFYTAALAPLGYKPAIEFHGGQVIGYAGPAGFPDFFLSGPESPASKKVKEQTGQEKVTSALHLAFSASTREEVRKFHAAAIAAGGKDNGEPGLREHYAPHYYGAFIIDPEGRNIEAVLVAPEEESK